MKTGNGKKYLLIICNALLWLLLVPLAIFAQQQEPALLIDSYLEDEARLNTAIEENEKLFKKYPDAEFAPTVMFQLCELYARKSDLEYQQRMNEYEQALADYDKGELQVEPTMPRVSFEQSITVGMQLLERFPNTKFKDRVVYRLAMNHLDAGDKERAKEYFEFLVSNHADSPLAPEAHFRIGEYYFERREFNNAVGHYRHLLNRWDNEYFHSFETRSSRSPVHELLDWFEDKMDYIKIKDSSFPENKAMEDIFQNIVSACEKEIWDTPEEDILARIGEQIEENSSVGDYAWAIKKLEDACKIKVRYGRYKLTVKVKSPHEQKYLSDILANFVVRLSQEEDSLYNLEPVIASLGKYDAFTLNTYKPLINFFHRYQKVSKPS